MEKQEPKHDLRQSLLGDRFVAVDEEEQIIRNEGLTVNHAAVTHGEKQPNNFRDAWAAVLFLSQQIVIIYLALAWGVPSLNYEYASFNSTDEVHFGGLFYLSLTAGMAALLVAALTLSVMIRWAEQLVQISLFLTLVSNFVVIIYFATHEYWYGCVASTFVLAWSLWYARSVWQRIPFAAANLKTALTAVHTNGGLVLTAVGISLCINIWSLVWMLAGLGVYVRSATCENGVCASHMNGGVIMMFVLSFYWTAQVGKNILHVTVSGVVGTWWFAPEDASSFCSPAINDSLLRATTYSLGSICLGSLLTALLQFACQLTREARRHTRCNAILRCVLECLVDFLERLVAYFNQWAYVYVGLYGYDYLTAGRRTMSLFMERGWTIIINDNLVLRVLGLMSVLMGFLTGCFGLIIASIKSSWLEDFGNSAASVAFCIPFLIGAAVAYALMSVVASAIDTVLVAFAEGPLDFERNHPGLYTQMITAWRQVYPEEFGM
jgi:hypothetical protein